MHGTNTKIAIAAGALLVLLAGVWLFQNTGLVAPQIAPSGEETGGADPEPIDDRTAALQLASAAGQRDPSLSRHELPSVPTDRLGAVRVSVLRGGEQPAPGVGVTLRPDDGRHPDLHARHLRSDAQGIAVFGGLPAGRYGVHLDRSAKTVEEQAALDEAERAAMILPTHLEISGSPAGQEAMVFLGAPRVTNSITFEASAEATNIAPILTFLRGGEFQELTFGDFTVSDVNGANEAPAPPPELHAPSRLAPEERAVVFVDVDGDVAEATLFVAPGVHIDGQVVDDQGRGVAEAAIWIGSRSGRTGSTMAHTDADGRFTIDGLDGDQWLVVRARGFAPSIAVQVSAAAVDGWTITLAGVGCTLAGRVVDAFDAPIDGGAVRIGDPDGETPPLHLKTDEHGRFEAVGLPGDHVTVLVLAAGQQPLLEQVSLAATMGVERLFRMQAGWSIEGKVRDPDGTGVADVTVRAQVIDRPETETTTDPDGSFRLECLTPGIVRLRVDESDRHQALELETSGRPGDVAVQDLDLLCWGEIAGTLLDHARQPLSGWTVQAHPIGVEADAPHNRTGGDGTFSLRTLPELRYRLEIRAPVTPRQQTIQANGGEFHFVIAFEQPFEQTTNGRRAVRAEDLGIGAVPGDTRGIEIRLPPEALPSAVVSGQLNDASGAPMAARLRIHIDGTNRSMRIKPDGVIKIGPLLPGAYRFEVYDDQDPPRFAPFDLPVAPLGPDAQVDLGPITPPVADK